MCKCVWEGVVVLTYSSCMFLYNIRNNNNNTRVCMHSRIFLILGWNTRRNVECTNHFENDVNSNNLSNKQSVRQHIHIHCSVHSTKRAKGIYFIDNRSSLHAPIVCSHTSASGTNTFYGSAAWWITVLLLLDFIYTNIRSIQILHCKNADIRTIVSSVCT